MPWKTFHVPDHCFLRARFWSFLSVLLFLASCTGLVTVSRALVQHRAVSNHLCQTIDIRPLFLFLLLFRNTLEPELGLLMLFKFSISFMLLQSPLHIIRSTSIKELSFLASHFQTYGINAWLVGCKRSIICLPWLFP